MGWTNDQSESLTLPPGGGVPRIFLGQGDPFAEAAGADAAMMFYWSDDEAYMIDVRALGTVGYLRFTNTDATGIVADFLQLQYDEATGTARMVAGFVDSIELVTTDFILNGVSQSQGYSYKNQLTTSSALISAETVVLTIPSEDYIPGRAYAVRVQGRVQGSTANVPLWRLRFGTTVAGGLICTFGGTATGAAGSAGASNVTMERTVKVDGTDPIVTTALSLTLQANTGTAQALALANEPFGFSITDVGAAVDFPQAVFL